MNKILFQNCTLQHSVIGTREVVSKCRLGPVSVETLVGESYFLKKLWEFLVCLCFSIVHWGSASILLPTDPLIWYPFLTLLCMGDITASLVGLKPWQRRGKHYFLNETPLFALPRATHLPSLMKCGRLGCVHHWKKLHSKNEVIMS